MTVIVNNAGVQNFKSFIECKEEEFITTMRVNLFASYWILKDFLPSMLSRNHGHIVSIASSSGKYKPVNKKVTVDTSIKQNVSL